LGLLTFVQYKKIRMKERTEEIKESRKRNKERREN
jgi:hypothetical protein